MGALMISIDCTHPDLEDFINLKANTDTCTKANISVRVTDEFMQAVINNKDWVMSYYRPESNQTIMKTLPARYLFRLLAERNWDYAEPGILYWDRIKNYNLLNNTDFEYAGVNPCAEEPLPKGGSCLLGSINLAEFVKNPFTSNACIDFDALEQAVKVAVTGLNQVLIEGMYLHPLEEQRTSVHDWRQIGLGTMGLADMLIKLCVTYGSKQSLKVIDSVYKTIATEAVLTSLDLAKFHDCYPKCNKELLAKSSFIQSLNLPKVVLDEIRTYGLYNSQLLTCAPTGSTATMLQTSTGVEPIFAMKYTRKTQSLSGKDEFFDVYTKIAQDYMTQFGTTELPDYFVESKDINPIDRINVQAVLQAYTDASISSTINLPNSATVEDVENIYLNAWEYGLKGITVYRSGCKREGILTTESTSVENQDVVPELKRGEIIKAGEDCIGLKRTLTTGCGTLHCEAFFDSQTGALRETYLSKGSSGGCNNFMIGLSRMISLSARGGIDIKDILDQLKSCGTCPAYAVRKATKHDTSIGSCCPVAVGNALKSMHKEILEKIQCCNKFDSFDDEVVTEVEDSVSNLEECPACHHNTLIHQGGCVQCTDCGWSKCD